MPVNLGDKVKDRVTGFEGIDTGITECLQGCRRVIVQPQGLHEGKTIESMYIDEPQLEVVKAGAYKRPEVVETRKGGPSAKVAGRAVPKQKEHK